MKNMHDIIGFRNKFLSIVTSGTFVINKKAGYIIYDIIDNFESVIEYEGHFSDIYDHAINKLDFIRDVLISSLLKHAKYNYKDFKNLKELCEEIFQYTKI